MDSDEPITVFLVFTVILSKSDLNTSPERVSVFSELSTVKPLKSNSSLSKPESSISLSIFLLFVFLVYNSPVLTLFFKSFIDFKEILLIPAIPSSIPSSDSALFPLKSLIVL